MRPWHVNPHRFSLLLCPPCGRQNTLGCVFWRAHPHGSHDPSLRRLQCFCHQPYISVANGDTLPSKPEGNALLLPRPEGMIHRTRSPTDLRIPLDKCRIPDLPLDNLEVSG